MVRKFQNEQMKLLHCPKYKRKNEKNTALFTECDFVHYFEYEEDKIPSQIQPPLTNMYSRIQTLALMTYELKNQTIGQKGRILDHITMEYSSFCKNVLVQ